MRVIFRFLPDVLFFIYNIYISSKNKSQETTKVTVVGEQNLEVALWRNK